MIVNCPNKFSKSDEQTKRKQQLLYSAVMLVVTHAGRKTVKARLHIGEATRRFLFVSLCRVQRFARVSVK